VSQLLLEEATTSPGRAELTWVRCYATSVEANFMMMNQAILMMPKAKVSDSRLIQDFKIKHQESNPRFKIQEKKSRSNKSKIPIG